ncbi:MAG: PQQ-binding-like beta-propeller repeat protein [Anaerolineae bacterium]
MAIWRHMNNRLQLSGGSRRLPGGLCRQLRLLLPLLALVLLASCGRGVRHESWPGLSAVDGTLYVANLEQVQAINSETGKVYWGFPSDDDRDPGPFYSTPVLAPEHGDHGLLLIAGFSDQTVYALALGASPTERPDEAWRFAGASGQYVGTGTVVEDLFIIGNGDGRVYAINLEDGTGAWQFATQDRVWATPVVIGETVYVASLDHHLYALDLQTGSERWRLETEGALAATPVVADGDLWIGDFAQNLYRVDPEGGEVIWTFEARDWLWSTPLVDDTIMYFADVGGNVYALDVESQTLIWDEPVSIGDVVRGRPALNEDGSLLYVAGHETGRLRAIDTSSGALRESWGTTPENPGRLPGDLLVDDERLYAMPILVSERVQAYGLADGELLWSSPQGTD